MFFVQTVPFGDLEVCVVVPRSDRHHAGSKRGVHRLVFDDRRFHRPVDPFAGEGVAVLVVRVALICRVHHDVFVTEFGLWAHGSDLKRTIFEGVERRGDLTAVDLIIRDIGLQLWIPVDDAVPAIDQPIVIHAAEGLVDTAVELLVHREAIPRPVAARAHRPHLIFDRVTRRDHILADAPQHLFASKLTARVFDLLLPLNLLQHDVLGRNRGVIGSWDPERFVATHAVPAN